MSAALTGRVQVLEDKVVQIFQELLLRVDLRTMSEIQRVINTQIDAFDNNQDSHETRIDNLEGLYSNLTYSYNQHVAVFTGHTGSLTGAGVHGHA